MTARNTFFYILISLFAILALGCNKTGPNPFEDEGDTDIVDNDNNQENDTDLVDQFDETADESADEATDEAVDEATDEADNFDESNEDIDDESIDTEEDPLAQFRWVEGVWRCTAGGIGYINHEYNVRLGNKIDDNTAEISGFRPCHIADESRIQEDTNSETFFFFASNMTRVLCSDGVFDKETGILTFNYHSNPENPDSISPYEYQKVE